MIAPKVGAKFGIQHACGVFRGCLGLVADPPPGHQRRDGGRGCRRRLLLTCRAPRAALHVQQATTQRPWFIASSGAVSTSMRWSTVALSGCPTRRLRWVCLWHQWQRRSCCVLSHAAALVM